MVAPKGRKYVEVANSLIERTRKDSLCGCSVWLTAFQFRIESAGLTVDESSLFTESPKIAKILKEGRGENTSDFSKNTLKSDFFEGRIRYLSNKTLAVSLLYTMLILFHNSGLHQIRTLFYYP